MYTNVSNIVKSAVLLLDRNNQQINAVIREYQSKRSLTVLQGMRATLPVDAYPSFEIEPTTADNIWATTRAQRPTYNFTCTLTLKVDKPEYGVEYIGTVANIICEIMTSPENLQMKVVNETRWDVNGGLVDTIILDSLVTSVAYDAARDGSVRTAEFQWFVTINETFPESKWQIGGSTEPSIVRPAVVSL